MLYAAALVRRNQALATYELASANLEGLLFEQLNEIRDDKPASTDPQDLKAGRLNGEDQRIGTSLLMHVMAGDQVQMNVNTFYDSYNPDDDNPVTGSNMLTSIVGTLTGGVGGFQGSEGHNPDMVQQLFTPQNYLESYRDITNNLTDPAKPKAYLNYVLFDENMRIDKTFSKAFQATGNGTWQQIGTTAPLTIPVNGYLAVYLSNESRGISCYECNNVNFDQLVIQIQQGSLLEETHYYPFGLPMAGLSTAAENNTISQRRKYQSNEYIKELGLNWMDFNARQYDPQLGRFLGVDPLATSGGQDMISPYAAMGNAPESMIDPNGEMPGGGGNDPSLNALTKSSGNQEGAAVGDYIFRPGGSFVGGDTWITAGFVYGAVRVAQMRAEIEAEKTAAKTQGNSNAQGGGGTASNLSVAGQATKGNITEGVLLDEVIIKKKKLFGRVWDWIKNKANDAAEETASSVILVGSSVVMPIINQTNIIINEGVHEGGPRDPDNRVSWAVPYKVKGWKLVRKDELMKENVPFEEGKEVIKSTVNVLMMLTPIKYDIPIPGIPSSIQKAINWGAGSGTKTLIKNGVKYSVGEE